MSAYVPLMLRTGWVLERYYGWKLLEEQPALKLLRKSRGPLRTFLLLTRGAADEAVAALAERHAALGPLAILAWNDFTPDGDAPRRTLLGRSLRRVDGPRWFGVGTFVFDLREALDAQWARMASRERTKCRKAEAEGVKLAFSEEADDGLDAFLTLYRSLARDKGLEQPRRALLERMFAEGSLLLTRCLDSAGRTLVANLTYLQDGDGYFLHGARAAEIPAGAGQLAHWETVRRLKANGSSFYDLGLVARRDDADGIYRFKKALGGSFVDFGLEYQRVPAGLQAAYRAFRGLRARLRTAG